MNPNYEVGREIALEILKEGNTLPSVVPLDLSDGKYLQYSFVVCVPISAVSEAVKESGESLPIQ